MGCNRFVVFRFDRSGFVNVKRFWVFFVVFGAFCFQLICCWELFVVVFFLFSKFFFGLGFGSKNLLYDIFFFILWLAVLVVPSVFLLLQWSLYSWLANYFDGCISVLDALYVLLGISWLARTRYASIAAVILWSRFFLISNCVCGALICMYVY